MIWKSRAGENVLTGVELGTGTVKVAIGEIGADDSLRVLGSAEKPSLQVVKGEVTDAAIVSEQLEAAVHEAEHNAGIEAGHVFLAVSGAHVESVNSVGSTPVQTRDHRVGEDEVINAVRNAHGYVLPPDKRVLHFLDRCFIIDGSRECSSPEGMVGSKLEADVHVVYGQYNPIETECRLVHDVMGYPPTDVAFSGVADSMAAVTAGDAEQGVLLVNIGAGTTEYALCQGAGWFHTGQITVGGEHIVNDLSIALDLDVNRCRRILNELDQFGSVFTRPDGRQRVIEVGGTGQASRQIPVASIEKVIELRLHELFDVIMQDLRDHRVLGRIAKGVWLCGGVARVPGIEELARNACGMPASVVQPRMLSGSEGVVHSLNFITPLGLIRWGRMMLDIDEPEPVSLSALLRRDAKRVGKALRRAFNW